MNAIKSQSNTSGIARRMARACVSVVVGILFIASGTVWAGACNHLDHAAAKASAGVAGIGAVAGIALKASGVSAVAHSSGATIATLASGGYVSGTLGAVGALTAILTAPATIIVGGIAVAASGGALAYCHYINVP